MDNVPQDVATGLVRAGLRVSFEQLLQASSNRTAGWEVWVKATAVIGAERCNVPVGSGAAVLLLAGLPPRLEMLCYKLVDLARQLMATAAMPPAVLPTVLQLAFSLQLTHEPQQAASLLLEAISTRQQSAH
uniref:Uncharacterized protein n=1 Tax=Tetradesmus obliquus TaxID=3088 RepID=A0A383V9V5_TETOB